MMGIHGPMVAVVPSSLCSALLLHMLSEGLSVETVVRSRHEDTFVTATVLN